MLSPKRQVICMKFFYNQEKDMPMNGIRLTKV